MPAISAGFGPIIQYHFRQIRWCQFEVDLRRPALQRLGPEGPTALGKPLNRGRYECIRGAIQDGSLAPATRLPPQRDLAAELGLSRNTVMLAYDQLLAEGYLYARTGSAKSPD
ncbi:GntR family transcriptional regulator [Cupriavidus necator]|uniref:GntR family transcriptional regulator n=1 Tax=Cupriavidus necator TaxID=106590 RepID=UPI000B215DCC|nr:GntR family transcriptional regulator [Cupriavidus necator]